MSALVVVTGGAGYLGQWCIVEAIRRGLRVRAVAPTVEAVAELLDAVSRHVDVAGVLETVILDPLEDSGWADAISGAQFVLHTDHLAGPPDTVAELNQQLAVRVLEAARLAGAERVVMTSSVEAARPPGAATSADERVWTDPTTSGDGAVAAVVERSAREAAERLGVDLVTLLPGHLLGPPAGEGHRDELWLVGDLVLGRAKDLPERGVELCDVRDVARSHVSALLNPSASGRYLVPGEFYWMIEVARVLRDRLGERAGQVPTTVLTGWRAAVAGWLTSGGHRPEVGSESGLVHASERARREVDWDPRNTDDTVVETAELLLDEDSRD